MSLGYALASILADIAVGEELAIRLHNGNPGPDGTANRIGTYEAVIPASDWIDPVRGYVGIEREVRFGGEPVTSFVLVYAYSVWYRGVFEWAGFVPETFGLYVSPGDTLALSPYRIGLVVFEV